MTHFPTAVDEHGLLIALEGTHNFRSVSSWRAGEGRVLAGEYLYRSDGLDQLSTADQVLLAELGIRHVFDLRASAERQRSPSLWPDSMDVVIWAGAESAAEADLTAMMQRDGHDAAAFHQAMCAVYARFPDDLAGAVEALAATILAGEPGKVLVHCAAGKDRTGFTVAMLLHAIGVPADEIMADYLLSNASFDRAVVRFNANGRFDALEARAPGATAMLAGVHPEYLHSAQQRIIDDFGSIGAWLEAKAGLDATKRARLRERLLA